MKTIKRISLLAGGFALAALAMAEPVLAQQSKPGASGISPETAYVLSTFSFLVWGAVVMMMAAGFTMLETGLVRDKNTSAICLKNMCLFSIAGLMFYLVGHHLMYPSSDPIGVFSLLEYNSLTAEAALLGGSEHPQIVQQVIETGHSKMSGWFFQMVFVATAASIISGTLAERVKVGPFLLFIVVLTGVLYPIQGQWIWGGGWLADMGFKDFAGSTVVHSVGGWCALTGAIILGARKGKYEAGGVINPMPGTNLPLATLGTFILWFGWFGFNAGSHGALESAADAAWMGVIIANTTLAAAAGVVAAMVFGLIFYGRMSLPFVLNGAIAGMVSITAGPDLVNPLFAVLIGGVGGSLMVVSLPLIERLRVDDVVGAISAHLVAGIWGTMAVGIFGAGNLLVQLTGVGAIAVTTVIASSVVWLGLKVSIGLRVSEKAELQGMDKSELQDQSAGSKKSDYSNEAFPEFGPGR